MSWNKLIASETQRVLSAPTWYARRTVIEDTAKLLVKGTKYNFQPLSVQFEQGDQLLVVQYDEEGKLAKEGVTVDIVAREMFEYELSAALPAGKVMIVKKFLNWIPLEGGKGYYLIPITREMLVKDKEQYRAIGIVSPGWYRWRQILDEQGNVVRTQAQLAVSMKNFSVEGSADEGQFDAEGVQQFNAGDLSNEGDASGIKLV